MTPSTLPEIMATMADVRCTPEFTRSLLDAGASSFRINSAHVDAARFETMVATMRSVNPIIPILMDTKGPEIRIAGFTSGIDAIDLKPGSELTLRYSTEPCTADLLSVSYPGLATHARTGMKLLLDDGEIELTVSGVSTAKSTVTATVTAGGRLLPRKSLSLPGADITDLPAVTERDEQALRAAARLRISMVAHSFVRSADDLRRVRAILEADGPSGVMLFAKIECRGALARFDEILNEADGLLVARGDLGVEIAPEIIPALQAEIIGRCHKAGKPVIVSTQMLHSMIEHPRPTRAEVADIAAACRQGADMLLLCGETASGRYPVEAVTMMRRVIEASHINASELLNHPYPSDL